MSNVYSATVSSVASSTDSSVYSAALAALSSLIFAAGVLFGTAGIKILGSKDAKKVYTNCTAAALRAKECVMKTASNIQENAEDIYAEAQQINEDRAAKAAEYTDESVEDATEETVAE